MNVYGRVPWEASMEYFIKNQTNKKPKAHSKPSKQHLVQIIWTKRGHQVCNLTEGLRLHLTKNLMYYTVNTNNFQACGLQWNLDICIFGHRYLNLNNLNLKQEQFRLQRKNTKVYRILNKYPSYRDMPLSHMSLRCRIPSFKNSKRSVF